MTEEIMDRNNALGWLREQHSRIRDLIASCLNSDEPEFTEQILRPLLQELKIHSAVEAEYFFPFMTRHVHKELVDLPAQQNYIIDALVDDLHRIDPDTKDFINTLDVLIDKLQLHEYQLETHCYQRVEGRDPDMQNHLGRLSRLMQARRDYMLDEFRRGEKDVRQRISQEQGRNIYPPRDVVTKADADQSGAGADAFTVPGGTMNLGGRKNEVSPEERRAIEETGSGIPPAHQDYGHDQRAI